jgi:hypothetical protein
MAKGTQGLLLEDGDTFAKAKQQESTMTRRLNNSRELS